MNFRIYQTIEKLAKENVEAKISVRNFEEFTTATHAVYNVLLL